MWSLVHFLCIIDIPHHLSMLPLLSLQCLHLHAIPLIPSHSPPTNSTSNNLLMTLHFTFLQPIASTPHDPSKTTTSNISLPSFTQLLVPPNTTNASSTHPMIIRSKDGTRCKHVLLSTLYPMSAAHATSTTPNQPTCYTQASKLP
ncbi:hypothetical protein AMTRI_Chr05g73400 [Amborella trichopoda]